MDKKFEAHITMPREAAHRVEPLAPRLGWTFSQIDGDPVMGKRPYCYLTAYAPNGQELLNLTLATAKAIEGQGIEVLRTKVEEIVWDSKTGHNAIRETVLA